MNLDEELVDALECLLDNTLANRDTPDEFVSCCTAGKNIPWYFVRAKQALERARNLQETRRPSPP